MGFLDRLRSWFRGSATSPDSHATFEQLTWLEPHENPFGVRVLDCRPVAESFISAAQDQSFISFFGSPESQSGQQYRGQHPEAAISLACSLQYPLAGALPEGALPEGPLFLASVMEEKWNIYHFSGVLYFVRSWTGQLHYVARLANAPAVVGIVEVEAWPGNILGSEQMAVRQVDYLIKSHVFNQVAPHPVPPFPSKEALALWSFSQYGRRGLFAALEPAATTGTMPAQGV